MSKVLNLFRRRGAADSEARTQRAAAPPPAPPAPQPSPHPQPHPPAAPAPAPNPTNPRVTSDDGGPTSTSGGVEQASTAPDLSVVARRQSQLNLNKFLAAAPSGLNAVLKNPSRGDLEVSRSQGSVSLSAAQQQLMSQPGGDSPPVKPARERRRSMMASELAATLQNIDVSQAALIMMPARMRQEMGAQHSNQSFSQPLPMMPSAPVQMRSSAPLPPGALPAALSADSYALTSVIGPGGGGGGGPVAGSTVSGSQPRLERKPSLLREAVKAQLQQLGAMPGSPSRTESGVTANGSGGGGGGGPELLLSSPQPQQPGSMSPVIRSPAGAIGSARRGGAAGLQAQQPSGGVLLGGPSRGAIAPGAASPTTHASQRRSEVGEGGPIRMPPGFMPGPVLPSNGGYPLSPTGTGNGNYHTGPGAGGSNKDLRRGGLMTRGSEQLPGAIDDDGPPGTVSAAQSDVRLPMINSVGAPIGRRDKEGSVVGGGRGGLTAADVAALSEAISSYQSEAARLRAMAVRKVDSRIKRAVMDRRLTADEDVAGAGPGSLLDGSLAGSLLAPLMRGQGGNGGNGRTSMASPARGGPRAGAQGPVGAAAAGGGGPGAASGPGGGGGGQDSVGRARNRLQETEVETAEELTHLRRNSNLGPRMMAADLMADSQLPRRR